MTLMKRGTNVALSREIADLNGVVVGVRFVAGSERTLTDNLVVAAILCDSTSRALSDQHFVFFNQLTSPDLSVSQLSEVLGEDNEQVEIDLLRVPPEIFRIVIAVYLNEGTGRRRTLGQLRHCSIRLMSMPNNSELVRSENLASVLRDETALVLGEMYRHKDGWKFRVIGDGYPTGIAGVAADYGIPL